MRLKKTLTSGQDGMPRRELFRQQKRDSDSGRSFLAAAQLRPLASQATPQHRVRVRHEKFKVPDETPCVEGFQDEVVTTGGSPTIDVPSALRTVRNAIGTSATSGSRRRRRHISNPSMPGMFMSSTIRRGVLRRRMERHSWPFDAPKVVKPALRAITPTNATVSRSSSTTRMSTEPSLVAKAFLESYRGCVESLDG